jgi:PadR family transcriptional regulator, regulatory protein PadR
MLEEYLAKLRRDLSVGALHLVILLEIDRRAPIHGYALIKAMGEDLAATAFKEGTVYPILNLLERDGLVRSRWASGEHGPQRKYYELTAVGRQALRLALAEWERLREGIDSILEPRKAKA